MRAPEEEDHSSALYHCDCCFCHSVDDQCCRLLLFGETFDNLLFV